MSTWAGARDAARRRAPTRHSRLATLAAAGTVAIGVTGALAAPAFATSRHAAPVAHGSTPSCALAPSSLVSSALGIAVSAPKVTKNGPVTVCTYPKGALSQAALVRFQTGMSRASFAAGRSGFTSHGEPTKTVTGLGDAAYSSTLGTGSYADSTIVVLKGKTELLVTAIAPLAKIETLAKKLLPRL